MRPAVRPAQTGAQLRRSSAAGSSTMALATTQRNVLSIACALCWTLSLQLQLLDEVTASAAATQSSTPAEAGWLPSTMFANSSVARYPAAGRDASNAVAKAKSPSGRAFLGDRIDNSPLEYAGYAGYADHADHAADYAALPASFGANEPPAAAGGGNGGGSGSTHLHAVLQPALAASDSFASSPSSGLTLADSKPFPQSYPYQPGSDGYYYPAPQYLPPSAQYVPPTRPADDAFDHQHLIHHHSWSGESGTSLQLATNTKNRLFVQPGKCSNSIEVGRVREVEVRTALKYAPDGRKGVCVLMLYAANELNKLAVTLQAVRGTTNVIPAGTWLETNVKMYALQAGDVQPVLTRTNFGANSPALILTKSNIVILSFYVDRPVDFFLDISTYQSLTC